MTWGMTSLLNPMAVRDNRIALLIPGDVLRVDAEPLLRLRAVDGPQAASERIAQAREELAYRLSRVDLHHRAGAFDDLVIDLRAIAQAAMPIGLTDLGLVAAHVQDCATRGDAAALGATLARLGRLGAQALDLIAALRQAPD